MNPSRAAMSNDEGAMQGRVQKGLALVRTISGNSI